MSLEEEKDIQVVVGIDFGTTYSGFSYCHIASQNNIVTYDQWPDATGQFKTNTVLQYDDKFDKVIKWGFPAFKPSKRRKNEARETKPVELFKLNLGNLEKKLKPKLPVKYKKAITDYLEEIGKLIKTTLEAHWEDIDIFKNVLLVFTVPAEYSEKEKAIMRNCAHEAKLIDDKDTDLLQFTTEPEAAAIYCMKHCLKEHDLTATNTTFMIVDCGGGTVDLTTRKLTNERNVGEVTERSGDYCGSTFVDREFLNYLGRILGHSAIDKLRENNYKQLQYLVNKFCRKVKFHFTGDDQYYELDLSDKALTDLREYVTGDAKELMEQKEWLIDINFSEIKSIFDPAVERILKLIDMQLVNCTASDECSIMFLVGGFSQSIYLQKRIKERFKDKVKNISVPTHPIAAVVRGATLYGLEFYKKMNSDSGDDIKCLLTSRVLKFTYGIKIFDVWKKSDPIDRKTARGEIIRFRPMAKRGDKIEIDKEIIVDNLGPCYPHQTIATFYIYYTREYDAKYCDEHGMELLGKLQIDLPDVHLGYNRPFKFGLSFGKMEITATARNANGKSYQTTLEIDTEDIENTEDTESD